MLTKHCVKLRESLSCHNYKKLVQKKGCKYFFCTYGLLTHTELATA